MKQQTHFQKNDVRVIASGKYRASVKREDIFLSPVSDVQNLSA
jgi:hypothetical protein